MNIKCDYCGRQAELVSGIMIYPHRPDLRKKNFYRCVPCNAYVGCHIGTSTPFGRLANAELRAAKMRAHAAFDPLWQSGWMKRRSAYKWLAGHLGIPAKDCHIGMFDVPTCNQVIEIINRFKMFSK